MRTANADGTLCTELPAERVEAAIDRLPEYDRRRARRWFHKTYVNKNGVRKPYPYRRGSESYAEEHPEFGVPTDQREFMYTLNQHGMSFREIEAIMHLFPQQGNDAQRCINRHIEDMAGRSKDPKPKVRGLISKARALSIVRSYMSKRKKQPKVADAIYEEISAILPAPKSVQAVAV